MNQRNNEIVSFEEDQYLKDLYFEKQRLLVILNTREIIYDDDDRIGRNPLSFWTRLKQFLSERKQLKIDEIKLQFRSHVISPLPKKAKAYYFSKGLDAHFSGLNVDLFNVGYLLGDDFNIEKYYVPSLELKEKEIKNKNDAREEYIIWNY
jgi:hypothetical protein